MKTVPLGPDGPVTKDDLPKIGRGHRFTSKGKAKLACAMVGGVISEKEVEERYGIPTEEVLRWYHLYNSSGGEGHRVLRERALYANRRPRQSLLKSARKSHRRW